MTNIIDIRQKKIERLSDIALMEEALRCGRMMERGFLTRGEKDYTTLVFNEGIKRFKDEYTINVLKSAIKVLRYFGG